MKQNLQTACTQLLSDEDLSIDHVVLDELSEKEVVARIYNDPNPMIKIFSSQRLAISDVLPILHHFDFRVINEVSYEVPNGKKALFVNKLNLEVKDENKLKANERNIKDLLTNFIMGNIKESCKLFKLVYLENFCFKGVLFMRTIIYYEDQLVSEFNTGKIKNTVIKHNEISRVFLEYFIARFSPDVKEREKKVKKIEENIYQLLKSVQDINEDRILKLFFKILENITRTNYFLKKSAISIKVNIAELKQYLKDIQPNIEIFIHHQEFSGVHLRMGKVSRGGIRYSSRKEDFRTEIKSLMATQEGKNAIIIPKGAKGGFIINKDNSEVTKEEFKSYYTQFIDALLDVVDNIKESQIVEDSKIVAYDLDDTYFVVAADKGTASMSDIANELSIKRGFWLQDAFASGGSNGFHHKKLGVTAKGAIKSVQRFFIEKGVDFYKMPITVVGIGSMNGDVFGNGMLESEYFKLIAAISHNEIFIDPAPDLQESYNERKKLFYSNDAKWSNYDQIKISKGGGVFRRSDKEISLTPEIQKLIKTDKKFLNGEELASALLKLPVDMLYNGGVGTYIKSSDESNISIGDKENEYVRIDANELNSFCVCEGGNLGLTQAARIEYGRNGGKINLDSIDNSAGVDTSDHEVNLKILLNSLLEKGTICEEEKDNSLATLSDYVVNTVLWTNYFQSLSISLDGIRSLKKRDEFIKVIDILEENLSVFKRRYFKIPKNTDIDDVIDNEGKLTRVIIAELILYSKIFVKNILNRSDLYDKDQFFERYLFKYFPKSFVSIYEDEIKDHPLKKEIISMIIANKIINFAGVTFLSDFKKLKEDKFLLKIKAYLITNQLFDANDVRFEIYRNDYVTKSKEQYKMLFKIEEEIGYNIKWMLKSLKESDINFASILQHKNAIQDVLVSLNLKQKTLMQDKDKVNHFFTVIDYLKFAAAVIKIKKTSEVNFKEVADVFYSFIQKLEIASIISSIENTVPQNENEALLRSQIQQLTEFLIVDVTKEILYFKRKDEDVASVIENFLKEKEFSLTKFKHMMKYLKESENILISDLSVVINHLLLIKH